MADERNLFKFEAVGALTTGVKDRVVLPFNGEIFNAAAVVGTAPTGGDLILDILLNGVTVFTTVANRPRVTAGTTRSGVSARPDVTRFVTGDLLEVSVAQVGVTVAGSDLDVVVQYSPR